MEMCTALGHLIGMLDRDQRTAKFVIIVRDVGLVKCYDSLIITKQNESISHQQNVPGRTSPHASCKIRKSGYFWKSLHRLKHALIIGAYLSLVTFPSILSAPSIRKSMSSLREKSTPKWLNPCGMSVINGAGSDHRMPDDQLIQQIINQAQITEARAKTFKEDFVRKTFNMNVEQLHNYYKDKDYDWLPTKKIPKKLNHPIPQDHLDTLEFKQTLLDVYEYLQKFAVGLEQIVWDEEEGKGDFKTAFTEAENSLRTLLCEIYTAIIEKDLTIEGNVNRDIMTREFRVMDNTSMKLRNWIIYRDYLNMLEYIIQVFSHLRTE